MVKSRKVIFRKSQKLLTERALSELHGGSLLYSEHSIAIHSISIAGYVHAVSALCRQLRTPSPRGKQFLWFLKIDLLRFHRIYLLFDWSNLLFFQMCLLRINLPNICVQIWIILMQWISVNVTEEVISFFWHSMYIHEINKCITK